MHDSPYSKKAIVLIDKPKPRTPGVTELKRQLGARLVKLNTELIEDYIPDTVYTRIGKVKNEEIQRMKDLTGRVSELNVYKASLSNLIAANLTIDDLNQMTVIKKAINKAASTSS